LGRAHRVVKRVRAGTVWVDSYRMGHYTMPFGGYRQSGLGRELGPDALLPVHRGEVGVDRRGQRSAIRSPL